MIADAAHITTAVVALLGAALWLSYRSGRRLQFVNAHKLRSGQWVLTYLDEGTLRWAMGSGERWVEIESAGPGQPFYEVGAYDIEDGAVVRYLVWNWAREERLRRRRDDERRANALRRMRRARRQARLHAAVEGPIEDEQEREAVIYG